MKKITFIGSLDSTFAKWDRRVDPEGYKEKRNLTKDIAKNKGVITSELREKILNKKKGTKAGEEIWAFTNRLHRERNIPGYNGKKQDTIYYVDQENRRNKIKELSEKAKKNQVNRKAPFDRPVSKSAVNNQTKTFLPPNNPNPKASSSSIKTPLVQAKKLPLRKIGLGAIGLATAGVIGYGLYRKVRNDKGKKRRRYFR